MRILIAEDQRDLNQLLKKRLKEAGYSVDACFDGAAVFDYLLGAEYDALVLDIICLLYTSPSPRDRSVSRMPSSA